MSILASGQEKDLPGPRNQAQFFRNTYRSHCDIYSCRERTAWILARPDGSLYSAVNICQRHFEEVLNNLPPEALEIVAAKLRPRIEAELREKIEAELAAKQDKEDEKNGGKKRARKGA